MHGGASTGAPKGNRNAWKHGGCSDATLKLRRRLGEIMREARRLLREEV